MRLDVYAHVRKDTRIVARTTDEVGVTLSLQGDNGSGDDICLFFDSIAAAEKLADAIYHLKMDVAADAIQADEPATV
jgi:hypothetical protein